MVDDQAQEGRRRREAGKLFSKLSRAIMVAAKEGGSDPASNIALQNAIEKARSYSMPKDNIERAIAKGAGEGTDGSTFETVVYEGYGPEGVAVIVEALTDNRNRTASDVRHLFTKFGGNLGATGAVAWQFERRGIVLVPADGVDEDELVLAAAEAGADDVERDGSTFVVSSAPEELARVREALEAAGLELESVGLSMVPEDDGRDRGRVDGEGRSSGSSRGSRTTTTSRTSTRTSTSRRPCWRQSPPSLQVAGSRGHRGGGGATGSGGRRGRRDERAHRTARDDRERPFARACSSPSTTSVPPPPRPTSATSRSSLTCSGWPSPSRQTSSVAFSSSLAVPHAGPRPSSARRSTTSTRRA